MTLNVVLGAMIFIDNRYVARWTPLMNGQLTTLSVGVLLALLRSYCWLSVSCAHCKRVHRDIGKEELICCSYSYMAFLAVSARLHHMHNMQKKRTQTNDHAV